MCKYQARRVKEWPIEVSDGTDVARDAPVHAAVQRIADNWMADGAEVNADLMRAACVYRDLHQRQHTPEVFGADDARDRSACAAHAS
jgi:hypothetical protein